MDRRLAGVLLVVAVCAAAAVVPLLGGLRVAGTARTIGLPPDPQVGDCVVGGAEPSREAVGQLSPALAPPGSSELATTRTPVLVSFEPCRGQSVMGEIVGVASSPTMANSTFAAPPVGLDCRSSALEYAGLVAVGNRFELPDQPVDDPVSWNLSIDTGNRWVLPATWLLAAGKTWSACIVTPRDGGLYQGRLAAAYDGRRLPDAFGTCWDSRQVSAASRRANCSEPHVAELIAAGRVEDLGTTGSAQITASCTALAAKVMEREDPSAAGELAVQTSPEASRISLRTSGSLSVLCYVAASGERQLEGSIVGMGDQPLRYAN